MFIKELNRDETLLESCIREVYELNQQIEKIRKERNVIIEKYPVLEIFNKSYIDYEIIHQSDES